MRATKPKKMPKFIIVRGERVAVPRACVDLKKWRAHCEKLAARKAYEQTVAFINGVAARHGIK